MIRKNLGKGYQHNILGILAGLMAVVFIIFIVYQSETTKCKAEQAKNMTTTLNQNRLQFEKSPYLLQHADNPVDWYPWGDEAFETAHRENKPIFLSIGYSTCHWCHVMEHESFEDPDVAELMNDAFINIKVDREERPDIDNIYMIVCQMMTKGGGWPLTIIMTPDKKPFFAGTYFPKESRFGRTGMVELIPQIKNMWQTDRQKINNSVEQITTALSHAMAFTPGTDLGTGILKTAYEQLNSRYDRTFGGFGRQPKFPTPHNLLFLLRYYKRTGDLQALRIVEKTLQHMRRGGIYDHLGFGFHRYSTDQQWLVPHFEKMLYDQALLAIAYIEAFQVTGLEEYAGTAREIFTYVLRDMTSPAGGFYSAEDADSEGEEGKYYLWTVQEIKNILGDDAELFLDVYNIGSDGNFIDPATNHSIGRNIPHRQKPLSEIAAGKRMPVDDLRQRLETSRQELFAAREERIHPYKDDKILTDWNGLMIAALAKGAQVFDNPRYAQAAARSAEFTLANLQMPEGRFLHRFRDGQAGISGNCDDYAFFIWGLLELYEATFNVDYLQHALFLNDQLLKYFEDPESGGFYFVADDAENLIVRPKEIYDSAVPSGNSVAMLNLLRLGRITANSEYEAKAGMIGRAFANQVEGAPSAHTFLMTAVDFASGPTQEVVIVGKPESTDTEEMLRALRRQFLPNVIVLFRPNDNAADKITKYHDSIDGKATAYVCQNYACQLPTTNKDEMLRLLRSNGGL